VAPRREPAGCRCHPPAESNKSTREFRFHRAHREFQDLLEGRAGIQQFQNTQAVAFAALDSSLFAEIAHGNDHQTAAMRLQWAETHIHHEFVPSLRRPRKSNSGLAGRER